MAEFRTTRRNPIAPQTPAHLFDLLSQRSPAVKFLWAHQKSVLDSYWANHKDARDVALELPTGAGKTLVGMLVGEFRRRALGQRTAVLCPTRQLAGQVAKQASSYGIAAVLLVGRQRDYDTSDFMKYESARAVAITTYSAVFNSNPKIDSAETLICDDAHSAGDAVVRLWSLEIRRASRPDLFDNLSSMLDDVIPTNAKARVQDEDQALTGRYVDAVSPILLADRIPEFVNLLDQGLQEGVDRFTWPFLREHVDACMLYCSPWSFELRPVVAPTKTHLPFANAGQRVYMSATLGEDGDLERSFGVPSISRVSASQEEWPSRATGRRLVLFPGMGFEDDPTDVALCAAARTGRALVLTASRARRDWIGDRLSRSGLNILGSEGVEDAVRDFAAAEEPSALVLANRYDGIDLPGEDCRLEIIDGLPRGMGHQEAFLLDRLHATAELRDRVRTRITQAMGRCTRDQADYSVVLALGDDFMKWVANASNRSAMSIELQAELEFGMEQSEERTGEEITELCSKFLDDGASREVVDSAVNELMELARHEADSCAAPLAACVHHETDFTYRFWQADYKEAHAAARRVIDGLEGGEELKPYLSFWFHQAAVAAYFEWKSAGDEQFHRLCAEHIDGALATSSGVRWYSAIKSMLAGQLDLSAEERSFVAPWFERVDALLSEWGIRGSKFAEQLARVDEGLRGASVPRFEESLKSLGRMLGYDAVRPQGQGAPDGVWTSEEHAFVWEAKSEADPTGAVSYETVRQAALHERRARGDGLVADHLPCITVLITPQSTIKQEASTISEELRVVSLSEICQLYDSAKQALVAVRGMAARDSNEALMAHASAEYDRLSLRGDCLLAAWFGRELRELPVSAYGDSR